MRLAVVRTTIWCVAPHAAALFGVEIRIIPSLHTKLPVFFLSFIKPWHNGEAHIGTGSGVNIISQHCELICPCRSLCVAHNGRSGITRNDTIIAIIARIVGDRSLCQRINLGIAGIALTAAACWPSNHRLPWINCRDCRLRTVGACGRGLLGLWPMAVWTLEPWQLWDCPCAARPPIQQRWPPMQ